MDEHRRLSEESAARIAGAAYLLALPAAMFAEFVVRGRLVVSGNAAATMQQIVTHERLFRLGVVSGLVTTCIDVVLIVALYLTLVSTHDGVALIALLFRAIETILLVAAAAVDIGVLTGLDRSALLLHGELYSLALLFFGAGSALYGWLWVKSRYMPAVLAWWGVVASAWIFVLMLSAVVYPGVLARVGVAAYGPPIFLFELIAGVWLVARSPTRRKREHD